MKIEDLGPLAAPVAMLILFGVGFGYGAVLGFAWRGIYDDFFRRMIERHIRPPHGPTEP